MGFFDKLFNSDSDGPNPEDIQQGIIIHHDPIELKGIFNDHESMTVRGVMRDPTKAIEAVHWDGLSSEAQEALSKQGFYREGDESEIYTIEP